MCQSGVPLIQFDFLPWGNGHGGRGVRFPRSIDASDGEDRLARAVCHGGQGLLEERGDVLERDLFLADVANPDDERDRFAVGVGPLLAGPEAQARLQATDFLAPYGHGFLVILLLRQVLCLFHLLLQLPGGELAQCRIDLDSPRRRISKNLLVLNLELSFSAEGLRRYFRHVAVPTCRFEFELQVVKFHFLPRSQVHVYRDMNKWPEKINSSEADALALATRYSGRLFQEKLFEILELHIFLADIANAKNQRSRFPVVVDPLVAGFEAQTGLQPTSLLAPRDIILGFRGLLHLELHRICRELRVALDHAAVSDLVLARIDADRGSLDPHDSLQPHQGL